MDARKARKVYWVKELRPVFPYGLNDRIGDESKTAKTYVNVGTKLRVLPRKKRRNRRGVLHNGISKIKTKDVINKMISVNKAPNFIKI